MTRRTTSVLCILAQLSFLSLLLPACRSSPELAELSAEVYADKAYAAWLGQMIGNFYGLPHENVYIDSPYPGRLEDLQYEGWPLERLAEVDGAFSDDDTDVEYMYLLQMEKHGHEPTYEQLQAAWEYHIRDRVWLANRAALTAMRSGLKPPLTGSRQLNPHWFQIDPQLVNEIWAVTAPGMVRYAGEKSAWAARITNDDWGIEPTIHYGAMYAAAFFENDVNTLIDIGIAALPAGSRFAETIDGVREIYGRHPDVSDWRAAREELAAKWYFGEPEATRTIWNANLNGACSILALLYGQGDFRTTLNVAVALGFDADNQAASMAGLLGVMNGTHGLPADLLNPDVFGWEEPFNDMYRNVSRFDLPDMSITGIADLTATMAERIIVAGGGKVVEENGQKHYLINREARFQPHFEIALVPDPVLEIGQVVDYTIRASRPARWQVTSGRLPDGLALNGGRLTGTPLVPGEYEVTLVATSGGQAVATDLRISVLGQNLAPAAAEVLAYVSKADTARISAMWLTVPRSLLSQSVSVIRDGAWEGAGSVFYSIDSDTIPHQDYYGYRWETPQTVANVVFRTGPMEENGGWFRSLRVQHLDDAGDWQDADMVTLHPKVDSTNDFLARAHFGQYRLQFPAVTTHGIRIVGEAGGGSHWSPDSQNMYYTSITELGVYPEN